MTSIIEQLIPNTQQLMTVTEASSVKDAMTLMAKYDFSQLPVIQDEKLIGIITSDSILRAASHFQVVPEVLTVSHATDSVKPCRNDDDLSDLLKGLRDSNAIPIVDKHGYVQAIVTSYDSAEYFRRRAEDLMLAEDIETTLRDFIETVYIDDNGDLDEGALQLGISEITPSGQDLRKKFRKSIGQYLKQVPDIQVQPDIELIDQLFDMNLAPPVCSKGFDELTLAEYIRLFQSQWSCHHQTTFKGMAWPAIAKLLEDVRRTRNAIAHFREVTPEQQEQLRFCINFLERHRIGVTITPVEMAVSQTTSAQDSEFPSPNDFSALVKAVIGTNGQDPNYSGEALTKIKELLGKSEAVQATVLNFIENQHIPNHEPDPSEVDDLNVSKIKDSAKGDIRPTGEEVSPNDSRYAPLAVWLQEQEELKISLTFQSIEGIIQDTLPPSARQRRNWWANDRVSHAQSQQWLEAGWRVANVNMSQERVIFARIGERQTLYIDFFNTLRPKLQALPDLSIESITNPQGRHWFTLSIQSESLPQTWLTISFARRSRLRLEHYIGSNDRDRNKSIFDSLKNYQTDIEADLGHGLSWERLYGKIGCRVALYREDSSIADGLQDIEQMQDWLLEMIPRFYAALAAKLRVAYVSVPMTSDQSEIIA